MMGWGWDKVYVPNHGPTTGLGQPWGAQRRLVPFTLVSCPGPHAYAPKSSPSQNSILALLSLPQLHQHPGGVAGVSWRGGQTPGWDPPTPSSCCQSKNKINPFAPS